MHFAEVAATWQQWIVTAEDQLHTARVLLPHLEQRNTLIKLLILSKPSAPVRMPPCVSDSYFLHCALAIENAFKGVITSTFAEEIKAEMRKTHRIPKLIL